MSAILARDIPDVLPGFFAARVLGDSFYEDVYVLVVDQGDKENELLKKFATKLGKDGKRGVALLIQQIDHAEDDEGSPADGPLRLAISFQAWEDRQINLSTSGTKKSAYQVIRHTLALFKGFTVQGVCKLLVPEKPALQRVPAPTGSKLIGWGLSFTGREDENFVTPKVERPAFTPARGATATVAIACATAGAAIWFTTDGTPPTPTAQDAASTATLYAAPIVVPDGGCTIFAQAVKADHFPSSIISATFTKP